MKEQPKRTVSLLAEWEMEVLEEGREWMRRRLQEKLRKLDEEQGAISPPERAETDPMPAQDPAHSNQRRRTGR